MVFESSWGPLSTEEVHGASVKLELVQLRVDGKRRDKDGSRGCLKYFGEDVRELIYTPRGRLLDDVADAIALTVLWLEKEGVIEAKFKREKAK